MKKFFHLLTVCVVIMGLSACGNTTQDTSVPSSSDSASSEREFGSSTQPEADASSVPASETPSLEEEPENVVRRVSVQFGENVVLYELNDSPAAISLYEQLPLTIEVEDYSTNEKIFYPPEELDTSHSPLAQAGAGRLAYYAPWGDVVMFYGDYSQNPSLYELGQAVSGGELVDEMSGTIIVTAE